MYTTPHEALRIGRRAAEDLAEALRSVGFVLPGLDGEFPLMGSPQVQLGSVLATEAHRLAAWIREQHG
jgi:hypothetical protein